MIEAKESQVMAGMLVEISKSIEKKIMSSINVENRKHYIYSNGIIM